MEDRSVPIDRSKHAIYTQSAKKCVQRLLRRYHDEQTSANLWEKIQFQYADYLKDEPPLGSLKITASVYDPILIFAWYVTVPEKPVPDDFQQDVFECFMGGFRTLGRIFDLNRKFDNCLANIAFKSANDIRVKEIRKHPASFRMGYYDYDKANRIVRYSFTQCPNAEFAKRHHLEHVLPVMCNCDHLAMGEIHGTLIREGTCVTSDCCDYCIVGDRNPLAGNYELIKDENGLLLSRKKKGGV